MHVRTEPAPDLDFPILGGRDPEPMLRQRSRLQGSARLCPRAAVRNARQNSSAGNSRRANAGGLIYSNAPSRRAGDLISVEFSAVRMLVIGSAHDSHLAVKKAADKGRR